MAEWAEGCAARYMTGIVTGETSLMFFGRNESFDGTSPGVLYCHGVNSNERELLLYTLGATYVPQLVKRGFIVVASAWGGTTNWGNAASVATLVEARTWLIANGAKNGPLGVWGVSMGFMTAATWWDANPTHVGAFLGVVPTTHAQNVYDDNAGAQAGMDAAYSGDFATNGAPRSPHLILADRSGTPGFLVYSSDDTIIRPADVASMATILDCDAVDVEPSIPDGHGAWQGPGYDQRDIVEMFSVLK